MADIVVSLTKYGRELEAQKLIYGYGFRIDYFALGSGGHDPGNPDLALPLDTDVTELPGQFFGPEPIDEKTLITATCPQFLCVAQPGEAVGGISNLGLIATVTYVPAVSSLLVPSDIDVGVSNKTFLPGVVNTSTETITVTAHGFVDGDQVVFSSSGVLPVGLNGTVNYFIVNSGLNTLQVSLTNGGLAVDITSAGTGIHTVRLSLDDTVTYASHGLVDDDEVVLISTNVMPGGIDSGTTYYVRDATPNTFKLSTIVGGPPLDITSAGVGIITVTNLTSLPPGSPVVGSTFLYALCNFPRRVKTSTSRESYTVTIQT